MWLAVSIAAPAIAGLVAAAGGLLALRRRYVVARITGTSMTPTYEPGDRVLVRRVRGAGPRRGQVVLMQIVLPDGRWRTGPLPAPAASLWFVKRVVAVAGEPVPAQVALRVGAEPGAVVPAGHVVVLGDGPVSEDSREWGYVPVDRVLGVAVRKLSASADPVSVVPGPRGTP